MVTILPKNKIGELPKTSGVYLFYEKNKIIYIGKAVNIKDRVKNHFQQPSYRDNLFIDKVARIEYIETDSEIEALILEANLIKRYQPKFNVVWRDDKNYFYVAITKSQRPVVFITHQPNKLEARSYKLKANYIGPFVEGNSLKKTLKFLRRVFPFYTSTRHPKNKCTWCHLDLCPGPNPNLAEYKKNIKKLILILKGKRKAVLYYLKKEMTAFSYSREYENAVKTRDKIYALEKVMAHAKVISGTLQMATDSWDEIQKVLGEILGVKGAISKIECCDVSNIQGKYATGSMVVFVNGSPDKSQYKKFRIKMKNEPNDIAMLKEVLTRRLLHPEWKYPEVMLIDGGIAQLNVAIKVKNETRAIFKALKIAREIERIKIISIAKGRQELFIEGPPLPVRQKANGVGASRPKRILLKTLPQEIFNLIIHLDDEAHRFAITYHKKVRKKALGLDKVL